MTTTAAPAVPLNTVTTPSGVEIAYFVAPKRKYEVRKPLLLSDTTGAGGDIHPLDESVWQEVPSVTTVLEVLDKPALPWWGMKMGIDAIRELVGLQTLSVGFDGEQYGLFAVGDQSRLLTMDELVDVVKDAKLTVNHVKNKAADRGNGVHNALEAWAAVGKLPDPEEFPEEERGYVTGLRAFLDDASAGGLEAEAFEVTVASVEHGYAGRFDLLARTSNEMRVVTKIYDKWKPKYTDVPPSRLLIDLKTSKDIYPTHLLQLEAYEGALVECGYGGTDARAVLHVTADGRYEFRRARATHDMFLAILATYHALADVKEAMKL